MRRPILRLVLAMLTLAAPAAAQVPPPPQTRAEVMDAVFLTAQASQSSVAGQALAAAASRIASGSEDLAALLRERQDTVDARQALIDELAVAVSGRGAEAEARVSTLRATIDGTAARIADLDARLAEDFPQFLELTNPAPMTIAEVQATLAPDEALILTLSDPTWTFVWAISPTRADWHRAEFGTTAISEKVRLLRGQLSGTGTDTRAGTALNRDFVRRVQPFDRAVSHEIYTRLFAPLEHVFGAAAHLMAVVDGPLTSLPLSVLVTRPPQGRDDDAGALRDTPWMLQSHALTTLPTVSALRALRALQVDRDPSAPTQADPFVGFGDPLLGYRLRRDGTAPDDDAPVSRGIYEDVSRVADLMPLPNTSRELRRLAEVLGAGRLFLGEQATETAVKQADLSRAEIVAFATHGLLADGLPGLTEPALVFTPPDAPSADDDALLTASEAAQLRLSASLVILSACDTAGSDGTPGAEGLSGLARAFIYAGARAILVSHWPVDDYAAAALTTGMIDRMFDPQDPRGRADALRLSTLALMSDPAEDRFAHPRIWAPFVVVGEGGRG